MPWWAWVIVVVGVLEVGSWMYLGQASEPVDEDRAARDRPKERA